MRAPTLFALALVMFVAPPSVAGVPRPGVPTPEDPAREGARVAVLRGRANLFDGERTRMLTRASDPVRLVQGFLEGGAGTELELLWHAAGSVRVHGASSFAFDRSASATRVDARFFSSMDVESRRVPLTLDLPGGWTLHLRSAALFLRELPDGSLEIEHRAGRDVRLTSRVERKQGSFPDRIVSGERLRLPAD